MISDWKPNAVGEHRTGVYCGKCATKNAMFGDDIKRCDPQEACDCCGAKIDGQAYLATYDFRLKFNPKAFADVAAKEQEP